MWVSLDRLCTVLKDQSVVKKIARHAFAGKVFLVGGAIRELALNEAPQDYDFVLTRREDLHVLEHAFGGTAFLLGKKPIQTHRIVTQDTSLDITFLAGSIKEDLERRDFTMNAIAYDIHEGRVMDPLGGIQDIEGRVIRYPNRETLTADPLRMLKAVRHFAAMRGFSMDGGLIDGIRDLKSLIHNVAPERIKYEFDRIVTSPNAHAALKKLEETGLLFELFPDLDALKKLDQEKQFTLETYGHTLDGFKYLPTFGTKYGLDEKNLRNVAYALLFHDLGKAHTFSYDDTKNVVHFFYHERFSKNIALTIMEKLRFSVLDMKTVVKLIESHMRIFLISNSGSTEKATRRLVYKVGDVTPSLVVLTLCDMYGSSGGQENESTLQVQNRCSDVMAAYEEWRKEPLPRLVTGRDLLDLGFEEGPLLGRVLEDIREKHIAGELTERGEALNYATDRLAEHPIVREADR